MKIPNKVKICGLNYKIKFAKKLHIEEGLAGCHNGNKLLITLQIEDYAREKIETTFFHEVMHAIDCHYLNCKLSEDQVSVLSNGLLAFLKDNDLLK